MKNFYEKLPEGYEVVKTIDAKDKKTAIIFNVVAVLLFVAVMLVCFLLKPVELKFDSDLEIKGLWLALAVFMIAYVGYIVLHELTHGVVYKLMTKRKLKFGLTLSVAFCGVPDVYVNKKTALLAVLAPFVVFSIILGIILVFLPNDFIGFLGIMLFSGHFCGCVGDLYVTLILLKLDKLCLMNDTGPKQTFYIKK